MGQIRVSASYLFNINLGGRYLLIKSERRNQYQPVGGCYKYYKEAEEFLSSINAIPEKKSNGVDSLMDLRLLVPEENLKLFVDWFKKGDGRETTFDREFDEELGALLPVGSKKLFDDIKFSKKKKGNFEIFYDEEKGINTIKPMDIISVDLTSEQIKAIEIACAKNSSSLILASREDIVNGYKILNGTEKVKIGSHTKNILINEEQEME